MISAVSGRFWRPRPWLAPLSPLYWAASRLNRLLMRAGAADGFVPTLPLVVVGALRAGGSGKTSVTSELARSLSALGLRPAILAFRIGGIGDGPGGGVDPLLEVRDGDDWRLSSEEAALLRRETGCRVFVTRNRAEAWRRLHDEAFRREHPFDILISDDGFQDPRLEGAFRLLLTAPGENPGLFDLLPGGPFRETRSARAGADLILEGPHPEGEVTRKVPMEAFGGPPAFAFRRGPEFPPGFERDRPWIAFCALGDNGPFLRDLERAGIRPVEVVTGRNHAEPPLKILQARAARHPGAGILCTHKDHLKLGPLWESGEGDAPLVPVGQRVSLDPGILAAVDTYRLRFQEGYLVHYRG